MKPHLRIPVEEASQVGEARRAAHFLAREAGFDDASAGRLAIAVTELGTNLVRHARGGALLVGHAPDGAIEVLSLDSGSGMDVARCLTDGYSSAGSAGQGLGAVRRAADRFSAFSLPQRGTVIACAVRMPPSEPAADRFSIAALGLAAPGERVSGDGWGLRRDADALMLMVADGLGHGPEAEVAAQAAIAALAASRSASPAEVLDQAHQSMRHTRGAAALLLALSRDGSEVRYAGAGNIGARLVSGIEDRGLMSQHGTLGAQVRRLQDAVSPWPAHAALVVHSDGILTRWELSDAPGLLQCEPAVIAGWLLRDNLRGRDDATVVVVKRTH